ncbi:ABC transporter ATP-binding protein [Azospirillum sp. RWY-5-1]|uniref:ABC transporter ATP-binding protein n=1 Tax=Azospirillum oleiclasticum TaxID=2735135 RepID=A0ABX2TH07_9PROT|nr:ABC transporter ATP-binding protein [Azospirillum oleiclasticum]NYZ16155.1 ABC transporter ATP-binding protein [Azospirillum oleiclasticum]NYZ23035.1 ABC transporter ATP-binding protein [Azospirillum oleiclasticum]
MTDTILEVTDLGKFFGGLRALSGVCFTVWRGEIFGIIGPNGAGKTTLFNCLSGALKPSTGRIGLDGRRIDGLHPHDICRLGLARTFQIVRPFQGMTVLGNVMVAAYGRHPATADAEHHAHEALRSIGMAHLAHLDAERLSVAEMRRLEIARAIATEPRLLLLDEMLAGLTATEAAALCDQIVALNGRGITIVMVEHSVPVISRMCARSIVLNFGTLLAEGTTQDVLRDPRVQEAYLGSAA